MNIVQYSPYFLADDTGTGNSLRLWCTTLSRQGMESTVLIDGRLIRRPPPDGVRCIPVRHRLSGRAQFPIQLQRHLLEADLFVVHGGWTIRNIVACRSASTARVPYIVTTHGVYNEWVLNKGKMAKYVWNVLLERRHLQHALATHLFFEEEREGLRRLRVRVPTIVAPNGISVLEGVHWDGGSGGYLLWLGRFDPMVKALDVLVRSLVHIPEPVRPTLRLHGPDSRGGKRTVARLAESLGVRRWVAIGDPIYHEEKWTAITRAAGYVHPSRWDTSPMAVGEAIGAGVPTLVADYPLGRLLASEGAAIMCERSPEGMARGILRLLSEDGARVGRRGRAVASGSLSWDTVARSWHDQVLALTRGASLDAG